MSIKIVATGAAIPSLRIDNKFIGFKTKTDFKWIEKRTGIKSRFYINIKKKENGSKLALKASLRAIKKSGINKNEINFVICCNFVGDYIFPCMAAKLVKLLKLRKSGAFDLSANCTSFQIGLSLASDMFKTNKHLENILLVGCAVQSPFLNWNNVENCMYFGDGAGAAVIARGKNNSGVISTDIFCDPTSYEDVKLEGGGSQLPSKYYNKRNKDKYLYKMSGIETWKQVITNQPKNIFAALKKIKRKIQDIDVFIFHQANKILIDYLVKKLQIPEHKVVYTVHKYGNTADASLIITLDEALKNKKIKKNDLVLISGVGAGFIYGTSIVKWD
jgi:3-oxoacyl-[acyl-carrier-protein] synthase-3